MITLTKGIIVPPFVTALLASAGIGRYTAATSARTSQTPANGF
jgi:hypothetical protein